MTTNNDTPRIFSDGVGDDADGDSGAFGREWRGEPDAAWFGWQEQSEPADGHPQASFDAADEGYPGEPETPEYPGYPEALGHPREPEYPSGPGYAPLPPDRPGYPAGPGSVRTRATRMTWGIRTRAGTSPPLRDSPDPGDPPVSDYPRDPAIRRPPRRAADAQYLGYAPEPGYGRDLEGIPPMESMLAAGHAPTDSGTNQRPGPALAFPGRPGSRAGGRASSLPPLSSRAAPAAPAETSDSLTAESLLNGKRSAAGSGWRHRIPG